MILLVGKAGSIVHWLENALDGFRDAGCKTEAWSITGNSLAEQAQLKLAKWRSLAHWEALLADRLAAAIRQRRPRLIVFVSAYLMPAPLYEAAAAVAPDVPRVGWVGDRFGADRADVARRLDRIGYTDSTFIAEATAMGFPANGMYLPLAANERLFAPRDVVRDRGLVFVANRTPFREEVVRSLSQPLAVYGRGWRGLRGGIHEVHPQRFPMQRLPELYTRAHGVLNIRNEGNVVAGLNQRSFEPLACRTPVLNDDLPDLPRCFVPGEEILVYADRHELNALHARLLSDPGFAARIGEAGYRRVMAEHSFRHRAQTILNETGLRPDRA